MHSGETCSPSLLLEGMRDWPSAVGTLHGIFPKRDKPAENSQASLNMGFIRPLASSEDNFFPIVSTKRSPHSAASMGLQEDSSIINYSSNSKEQ